MNWSKGFFRLWLLLAMLWVLAMAALALTRHNLFADNYQYVERLKVQPWEVDWSKPYYETRRSPAETDIGFAEIEPRYLQGWLDRVKAGRMVELGYADGSNLYMSAQLTSADQKLIDQAFTDGELVRHLSKLMPWLLWAGLPPLALLLLGLAVRWVARGFGQRGA